MRINAKIAVGLLALAAGAASASAFAQQSTSSAAGRGQVYQQNNQDSSTLSSTGTGTVDAGSVYQPGSTVDPNYAGGSAGYSDTGGQGG